MITCTAPGKLMLGGEYAVLDGHPALVAAVDRRASSSLAGDGALTLAAVGLGTERMESGVVTERDGEVTLEGGDDRFGLVHAVLQVAVERGAPLPSGQLTVDTRRFYLDGEKLGLGSSAAVAVSVAGLLLARAGDLDDDDVHSVAATAHARFSGGRGSGADIAASVFGGVIRFERADGDPLCHTWPLAPGGLTPIVAFAGASVSTRELLAQVDTLKRGDRARYDAGIRDIAWATLELLDAVSPHEDPRVFVAAVDRCRRAMQRFGDRTGIDIVSPPHRRIARVAREHGGAAKPSGAGVGDVAIAFVPSANADALRAALIADGFRTVDCDLGGGGVRLE